MSEPVPEYRVEELTEEEQKALIDEAEHHQQMSCQSDGISRGESDLSMRSEEALDG